MKKLIVLFVCITTASALQAADGSLADLPEDLQDRLEDSVKIVNVNDDTIRSEADRDQKIEVLKFQTWQDEQDEFPFRMRVTMELTDRDDNTAFGQLMCGQGHLPLEYTGEDDWEFQMPHGPLEKAKLTAYAIEYGILYEGRFIPLARECDDVDSSGEIVERCGQRMDLQRTYHRVWYRE